MTVRVSESRGPLFRVYIGVPQFWEGTRQDGKEFLEVNGLIWDGQSRGQGLISDVLKAERQRFLAFIFINARNPKPYRP